MKILQIKWLNWFKQYIETPNSVNFALQHFTINNYLFIICSLFFHQWYTYIAFIIPVYCIKILNFFLQVFNAIRLNFLVRPIKLQY